MGTISEKLTYLNDTKTLLKYGINSIGGNISNQTTFRDYAIQLENIYQNLPKVSGSGTNINLSPTKVGRITSQINGDTQQDGTPTPDNPVEIQSVTGEQVITIEGKNLFDKENTQWYRNNESAFSNTTNTSTKRIRTNSFEIKGGETYTLSEIPNGITPLIVSQYEEYNGDRTSYVNFSNNTFTLSQNTKYINLMFSGENFTSETNTLMANANIQLEKGSSATEYEPYQGQDYEINLGKNLMPLYEYDSAANRSKSFNIWLPAGTYTCSFNLENFELGTNNNFSLYMGLYYATSSQDITLLSINSSTTLGKKSVNFTTTNDIFLTTRSSNIRIGQTQHDNGAICKISNIQIEKGSQATSYSPYFTPIHLYEGDQIIGTPDNWSIKHNKVKDIFDENSNLYFNGSASTPTERSTFRITTSDNAGALTYVSNRFIYGSTTSNRIVLVVNNNKPYLSIDNTIAGINTSDTNAEKEAKIKTWLGNNNVELVYELATPTTEPITNTELISQLNAFYYAKSCNGQTNISVDGNLPAILDVSALKGE